LRIIYLNGIISDQKEILNQLVEIENGRNKYFLMNYKKKKHLVCAKFFGKVYQISHTTLLKYLKETENSVIILSSEKKQRK
jgi:hypothetical protein